MTKKLREQAAHLCALMASNNIVDAYYIDMGVNNLAWAAWRVVYYGVPWEVVMHSNKECWAEAEALLRTGWDGLTS